MMKSRIVVISAFILNLTTAFPEIHYSLIFGDFFKENGISSTTISWIYTIHLVSQSVMTIFSGAIFVVFGYKIPMLLAGLFISFSFLIPSFFLTVQSLCLFFSLLSGIGTGTIYAMINSLPSLYFTNNPGLPIGIINGGFCLGQFVGPFLISFLKDKCKDHFILILGLIFLSISILGLNLDKPKESYNHINNLELAQTVPSDGKEECGSFFTKNEPALDDYKKYCTRTFSHFRSILKEMVESLKLMKSVSMTLICVASSLLMSTQVNFFLFLPLTIKSLSNAPEDLLTLSISAMAIFHFLSRSSVPGISDILPFSRLYILMSGSLMMGLGIVGFTFALHSKIWTMISVSTFGIGIGFTAPMRTLIAAEYLGFDNMARSYTNCSIVLSICYFTCGPLYGWIRDYTNNYFFCLWCISAPCFLSFIMWCILPIANKYDQRRQYAQI